MRLAVAARRAGQLARGGRRGGGRGAQRRRVALRAHAAPARALLHARAARAARARRAPRHLYIKTTAVALVVKVEACWKSS